MSTNRFIFSLLSLFILSVTLSSCESKQAVMDSTSPDGLVKIKIDAQKSFMEPWNITITIEGHKKKKELKDVIMYADGLTDKNIIFNWQDSKSCTITFIEQDDTQRTLVVEI